MKPLVLVRAAGLTVEQTCRGDVAANLSDLIADGSFAEVTGPTSLDGLDRSVVRIMDVPFTDMGTFDQALDGVRAEAATAGAEMAILSDGVLVTQRYLAEIKPGTTLDGEGVKRILSDLTK